MSKWLLYCCSYILILQFQQSSSLLCEMYCFTLYLAGRWHHFTVELPEKRTGVAVGKLIPKKFTFAELPG